MAKVYFLFYKVGFPHLKLFQLLINVNVQHVIPWHLNDIQCLVTTFKNLVPLSSMALSRTYHRDSHPRMVPYIA